MSKPDGSTDSAFARTKCGWCGADVSAAVYAATGEGSVTESSLTQWVQCPTCGAGSVIAHDGKTYPPAPFGPSIEGLPTVVESGYLEARKCMAARAYVAAELISRTILMYVAVDKGDTPGRTFVQHIDYLVGEGYVTPPMKGWVDLIRDHGNKSGHELDLPDEVRASATVMFLAELLRLTYEMEYLAQKFVPPTIQP